MAGNGGAMRLIRLAFVVGVLTVSAGAQVVALPVLRLPEPFFPLEQYGPYNAHILAGGRGLVKALPAKDPVLGAGAKWTLSAWVEVAGNSAETVPVAGVGDAGGEDSRYFVLAGGKAAFRVGRGRELVGGAVGAGWHFWTATFDGAVARFYVDRVEAGSEPVVAGGVAPELVLGPVETGCAKLPCAHFGGRIAGLTLGRTALSAEEVRKLASERPDAELIVFEEGSKPWPLQQVQFAGNVAPQEPWTMPKRNAPFSAPVAAALPPARTTLEPAGAGDWVLRGGWKLAEGPEVTASGAEISTVGFDVGSGAGRWMAATVPGTVLTTMIDRGRYPDPDFGLNNLAIPERLSREEYWYRAEFDAPTVLGEQVALRLDGINYSAEVWFNGERLGAMKGAFTRGVFDVTKLVREKNAVAIRIAPVPHPGIPNEQSIVLGAGLNGGAMELDGPTFLASEGWDWNPPMHDRDTGLWQDVHLVATGAVAIGDERVVTKLALPDRAAADVSVEVPLGNLSGHPVQGVLRASFEGVEVTKRVVVPAGGTVVKLASGEFSQLHVANPRLWWPNGYGKPELYHLTTTFAADGAQAEVKKLRFGIREISYELSLLDNEGGLRRVDYDPTLGRADAGPQVDVRHEAMREVPGGWAASMAAGAENSPAFRAVEDTRTTPFLTIRVNGVRIAVRGGSWGMDDSRKRVGRERMEPFFRFDQEANLNIIRNWQGQNTEEAFYDLADEYGMLVWNDFWEVTTDSNAEAEDPALFLANAKDTILRYRNHPSIAMWCGRNEGVPQPVINEGLIRLTHELDGTRYYSPSSNEVNLLPSGPYSYEEPADYATTLDRGFAVEVGTSSLPTEEWFGRWLPKQDRWPITDDWAYHNWHPNDALNEHMQAEFGAADSLKGYVKRAQMMNYVDYRAIFEGFNAHLWSPNTGRLLWMTQPSWPSMLWGILTSDYDTQASYYGTKKACEPVHVQMDVATNDVQVIDTTREALRGGKVEAEVWGLDGRLLLRKDAGVDAAADDVTTVFRLGLVPLMGDGTVLVQLRLHGADGAVISENLYWRAASDAGYRALVGMGEAKVVATARRMSAETFEVSLKNAGVVAALNVKLGTFFASNGAEVLPAFYSDNYVSLLPGEARTVTVDAPGASAGLKVKVDGWNLDEEWVEVAR